MRPTRTIALIAFRMAFALVSTQAAAATEQHAPRGHCAAQAKAARLLLHVEFARAGAAHNVNPAVMVDVANVGKAISNAGLRPGASTGWGTTA